MLIDILINLYSILAIKVRWQGSESSLLNVKSGVRQGGTLSPLLFNIYVNCMLDCLRSSDLGCHLKGKFIGCIVYADDLLLISASLSDLQSDVALQLSNTFNASKSKCIIIGLNKIYHKRSMCLNGKVLEFVNKIKYLGIWICC